MDRAAPVITSFAGGEVSPLIYGRQDLKSYFVSSALVQNFICTPQGPLDRRGGTRYVAEAKYPDRDFWMVDFEYNDEQAYVIEAGHNYMRFFMNRGRITVPATVGAIANGAFFADLSSWTAASVAWAAGGGLGIAQFAAGGLLEQVLNVTPNVLHVLAFRVGGLVGRDKLKVRIGSAAHGSQFLADREVTPGWHLVAFTPTAATAYLEFAEAGGTAWLDDVALLNNQPLELVTPFTETQVQRFTWDQSADVIYIVDIEGAIAKLERRGHTTWSLVLVDAIDGPYLPQNSTTTTLTPAATTGNDIVLTASAVTGINNGKGFQSTDVGRAVRLKHGATWGWARISVVTDTTHVKLNIRSNFGGTTAVTDWQLGLFSDTTGWPAGVSFHEERLIFAFSRERPARLDGSKTGDFETFAPGTADGDAFAYNTGTRKGYWLASTSVLVGGALGGAFVGRTDSVGSPITPTNFQVKANGRASAAPQRPLVLDDVIYLHRHRQKMFAYGYDFEKDRWSPTEITLLAEHLTRPGVRQYVYQEQPFGMIWACRDDGMLLGCTYLPEQSINAWQRHPLARTAAGAPKVRTLCCIPGTNRNGRTADELWLGVQREIDGEVKRFIELLEEPLPTDGRQDESYYVDCGLSLDNEINVALTPASAAVGAGVAFAAAADIFEAGDVGREIHVDWIWERENASGIPISTKEKGRALITAYVDPQHVTCEILKAFPGTDQIPANGWRMTVTEISGLDHLEGETVQILGDGGVIPSQVVTGGAITLPTAASRLHIGLRAPALFKPLPIEAGRFAGSSTRLQRILSLTFRFLRSVGGYVGRSESSLFAIDFRTASDPMNEPEPLLTGIKKIDFPGEWQYSAECFVAQLEPLPCTLLSITPELAAA